MERNYEMICIIELSGGVGGQVHFDTMGNNNTSLVSSTSHDAAITAGGGGSGWMPQTGTPQDPMSSSLHAIGGSMGRGGRGGVAGMQHQRGGGGGGELGCNQLFTQQFWRETAGDRGAVGGGTLQNLMGKANITVNPGGEEEHLNWGGSKPLHLQQESIL